MTAMQIKDDERSSQNKIKRKRPKIYSSPRRRGGAREREKDGEEKKKNIHKAGWGAGGVGGTSKIHEDKLVFLGLVVTKPSRENTR